MPSIPTLQVFEHESLRVVPSGTGGLTQVQFDALVHWQSHRAIRYFEPGHRKITFGRWVGVIRVGNLLIEILPKADRTAASVASKQRWHRNLIEMLRITRDLPIDLSTLSTQALRRANLMDIYLFWFLQEVRRLAHEGLVKRYRHEDHLASTALQGRLLLGDQLTRNGVHQERFACRKPIFDRNNLINGILKAALAVVAREATQSATRDAARQNMLDFEGIDVPALTQESFLRICWDRRSERYRETVEMARLIILGFTPEIQTGGSKVFALLFDMSQLWEKYVVRRLKEASRKQDQDNLKILAQNSRAFWEGRTIRPDILVRGHKRDAVGVPLPFTVVLDTKWKQLSTTSPSGEDLRQMFVYNRFFECEESVLVYPKCHDLPDKVGSYHHKGKNEQMGCRCKVAFLDVCSEDGHLDTDLGKKLILALNLSGSTSSASCSKRVQ